jgi:hypothetical protein
VSHRRPACLIESPCGDKEKAKYASEGRLENSL